MIPPRARAVLPRWLWLWFPPALLVVIVPVRALDPAAYARWIDGELGLVELATPLLAFAGAYIGVKLTARLRSSGRTTLLAWVALVTLACVYFGGEELSWGQQLFGWKTPAVMERINDQHETNLHNVSSWFDQKPRLLLEIWVLIGGVVVPLRERLRGSALQPSGFAYWFWPTMDCLPSALLAILVRVPERAKDVLGLESLPLEIRYSEPQEYYFALFLLIYLASLSRRLAEPPGDG